MGQINPNSFPDNHAFCGSSGEALPSFSRPGESAIAETSSALSYLPSTSADNPRYGWETAWIDLGGEG